MTLVGHRTNVSVVDGMTNGAECIVKKVDYRVPGSTRPCIIWVLFQEEYIGKDYRKEYSHLYNQSIDRHWVPILEVTRQFRRHQMQVLHRQFPLRPSAAKTIHRCQGDTLDEAVADLSSFKQEHVHYVAFSRLRSISGLHILNMNENNITVSKKVQEEMTRLRQKATLNSHIPFNMFLVCLHGEYNIATCLALWKHHVNLFINLRGVSTKLNKHIPFLYKDTSESFKTLYQNVRSLHLHIADVASDYNVKAARINIFVETALCSNDDNALYGIPGFQLFRNDVMQHGTKTPYGTAIYTKNDSSLVSQPLSCNYNDVEMTLLKVNQPVHNLHVVGIYCSTSKVKNRTVDKCLKIFAFYFFK